MDVLQLDMALKAAGIPIDGVSLGKDGSVRVDYASNATQANKTAGAALVASFDGSPAATAARQLVIDKAKAKAALNTSDARLIRGVAKAMIAMMMAHRAKINEMADKAKVAPLPPAQTWDELVAMAQAAIDAE